MHPIIRRLAVSLAALAVSFAAAAPAFAQDSSADEILNKIAAVQNPVFDRSKQDDEAYQQEFSAAYQKANEERAALILELYRTHPDHARLAQLMPQRWQSLQWNPEHRETVTKEMDEVIARDPKAPLAITARYLKTEQAVNESLWGDGKDLKKALTAAEEFIAAAPEDERGASLLARLADAHEAGSDEQVALYERIKATWPTGRGTKYIDGKIKQVKGIGKPFELTFHDAISGDTIDMKDLRGKVVVIDFWATWCGPCVAEMPTMKKLYAEHKDKGVEFIGVSLDQPEDQGGLEALKKFVEEKEIAWPQYYQGKGWESEFSTSWGINGIPSLFIVDKQGKLRSVQARGKLETLIPELLAE